MQFNRRVLEEADDASNPLLERVKFLAITGNNLDEYVEVRQAGLMQRIEDGYREPGFDGLRPDESLAVLTQEIHDFVAAQYRCWNEHLVRSCASTTIRLLEWKELSDEAALTRRAYSSAKSTRCLLPSPLTRLIPCLAVLNKALCLALLLRAKRAVQDPRCWGRSPFPRPAPVCSAYPPKKENSTTCAAGPD